MYIPEKRHVEVLCNFLFDEKVGPEKGYNDVEFKSNHNKVEESIRNKNSPKSEQSESDVERQEESDNRIDSDGSSKDDHNEDQPGSSYQKRERVQNRNLRDRGLIKPHPKHNDYITGIIGEVEDMPVSVALSDSKWKRAMQDEMNSLHHMKTWELTDLPEGRKPLTCRWILRQKGDGRMKARLVARGFDQQQGIDYIETFAPVACHASIRLLLNLAIEEKSYIKTFDIKTAFLNGEPKDLMMVLEESVNY